MYIKLKPIKAASQIVGLVLHAFAMNELVKVMKLTLLSLRGRVGRMKCKSNEGCCDWYLSNKQEWKFINTITKLCLLCGKAVEDAGQSETCLQRDNSLNEDVGNIWWQDRKGFTHKQMCSKEVLEPED